jgi:hypothetical protein
MAKFRYEWLKILLRLSWLVTLLECMICQSGSVQALLALWMVGSLSHKFLSRGRGLLESSWKARHLIEYL